MNVPNHEKKPFRDMTPEEQSAIVEAWFAGDLEYYCRMDNDWRGKINDGLYRETIYRTKPRQLVIPWEHIKKEYQWAAMDEDGGVWLFGEKPNIDGDDKYWGGSRGFCQSPLSINTTGIDWRESLTDRPEGV